jgi:ankyrin repeat protein
VPPKFGSVPSAVLRDSTRKTVLDKAIETVHGYPPPPRGNALISEDQIQAACNLTIRLLQDNDMGIRSVFQDSVPPLHYASSVGALSLVSFCLNQGLDVNQIVEGHGSPLCAAIEGGHNQVTEYLLSRDAVINTSWTHHESLMHYACKISKEGTQRFE